MTNTLFAALALGAILTTSTARPADAQIGPEAGVSLDVFARPGSGGARPELQANVSTALTDKWSAEALVSVTRRATAYDSRVDGEYGAAFKRYSTPDAPTSAFFSVGMLGGFSRGHDASGGYGLVYPPLLATIGGGSRSRIAPRLTVEAEIDVALFLIYPVGFRTTVGVAVPIGRHQR